MAGAGQDGKLNIFFWHDCFTESFTKLPYLDDDDDDEDRDEDEGGSNLKGRYRLNGDGARGGGGVG